MALSGWYLFLLGLATGIVVLDITVYRKLSSRWLRWTLIGLALFVAARYLTLVLWALSPEPPRWLWLRHCWLASIAGLTLPSVLALDQLLRHPSWSAKRVLTYFSPFLLLYMLIIGFGPGALQPRPIVGWTPALRSPWRLLLIVTQSVFALGFAVFCVLILLRMRSRRVRLAVGGLLTGHLALTLAHVPWLTQYTGPVAFLIAEILTLAAIGHAFDTAVQRAG